MRSHMSASTLSSPSEKRERKCSRTTARCVTRAASSALAPGIGQAGVGAARVVLARAALQQAVALEAVDQAREPAARQLGLLGQVAHAHPPRVRLLQVVSTS